MWAKAWFVISELYDRLQKDEVTALGAQLTYYLILSFFPFLIFLLTLVAFTPVAATEVLALLFAVLPESSYELVADIVEETVAATSPTLLSVGMLLAIWTSSSGMNAVIKGINKAYRSEEKRPFWVIRSLSIVYTLIFGLLVIVTFVLIIFGQVIGRYLFELLLIPEYFKTSWNVGRVLIPIGMMIMALSLLYKQAPNFRVRFAHTLPGAVFSTVGWLAASLLFSYYVNQFGNYSRAYGSIGGMIVLLIWLYISSVIIIVGGQLNAVLHLAREHHWPAKKFRLADLGISLPRFRRRSKTR
jgi:membrane protein